MIPHRVLESKHPGYKVGSNVVGELGWRSRTVINPDDVVSPYGGKAKPLVLPDFGEIPLSTALGALGMPGYVNSKEVILYKLFTPSYNKNTDIEIQHILD